MAVKESKKKKIGRSFVFLSLAPFSPLFLSFSHSLSHRSKDKSHVASVANALESLSRNAKGKVDERYQTRRQVFISPCRHNVIESMRLGYRLSPAWCEYLMNVAVNEARPY